MGGERAGEGLLSALQDSCQSKPCRHQLLCHLPPPTRPPVWCHNDHRVSIVLCLQQRQQLAHAHQHVSAALVHGAIHVGGGPPAGRGNEGGLHGTWELCRGGDWSLTADAPSLTIWKTIPQLSSVLRTACNVQRCAPGGCQRVARLQRRRHLRHRQPLQLAHAAGIQERELRHNLGIGGFGTEVGVSVACCFLRWWEQGNMAIKGQDGSKPRCLLLAGPGHPQPAAHPVAAHAVQRCQHLRGLIGILQCGCRV